MWLRDKLPSTLNRTDGELPMARVITYGYESRVSQSDNFATLEDLASPLWTGLRSISSKSPRKPILLVAHSLGGLVLKEVSRLMLKNVSHSSLTGDHFQGVDNDGQVDRYG